MKKKVKKATKSTKTTKKAPAKKAAKKVVKKVAKKVVKAKATKKTATKRKPNAAFMKPLTPSEQLAKIVGASALARTEVVKKVWAYIKKNKLQDPKNLRNIIADDLLKPLFGGKSSVTMFELTKFISKHLK